MGLKRQKCIEMFFFYVALRCLLNGFSVWGFRKFYRIGEVMWDLTLNNTLMETYITTLPIREKLGCIQNFSCVLFTEGVGFKDSFFNLGGKWITLIARTGYSNAKVPFFFNTCRWCIKLSKQWLKQSTYCKSTVMCVDERLLIGFRFDFNSSRLEIIPLIFWYFEVFYFIPYKYCCVGMWVVVWVVCVIGWIFRNKKLLFISKVCLAYKKYIDWAMF